MPAEPRVLLVFLDGVGIGPEDPDLNPFFVAALPTLRDVLGGTLPSLTHPQVAGPRARTFPLDARLDVDGTPQSGTGQTSLLTGTNAAKAFGRHFGPWVPVVLRPLLREENLLVRAQEGGHSTAFANAYPEGFLERYPRMIAAPPLMADAAGLMTRHVAQLSTDEAVASEIVNTAWRERLGHDHLPVVSAEEAGQNLASITARHDLTFFAHYATDNAGHSGDMAEAVAALERVDAFLGGLLDGLPESTTLLVASDHGNLEDVSAGHTLNPSLGLEIGPSLGHMESLTDVTPAILAHLHAGPSHPTI